MPFFVNLLLINFIITKIKNLCAKFTFYYIKYFRIAIT